MNNYSIYVHINKINGLKYVGQTSINPATRWGSNGIGYKNQYFYTAIKEYGWDNFEHIILETGLTALEANQKERYWIKYFNSVKPFGYNIDTGGGGKSSETREKMKNSWTPKMRENKRQLLIRYNHTADRSGANNGMYGRSRKGELAGNKKKVQCIETGEIFATVADASRWCNNGKDTLKSHIAEQIKGKRQSCGKHPQTNQKLHWRYITDEQNKHHS